MPDTAKLIETFETCQRKGVWSLDWEPARLTPRQLVERGIRAGLTSDREDFGACAGETVVGMIRDHELDAKADTNVYQSAINCATLADILATAIRKPSEGPWRVPEPAQLRAGVLFESDCLLSPAGDLRRVVLVQSWSPDRHYHTCRTWASLGAVCAYGRDLQIAICMIGPLRDGKFRSPWSQGLLHPRNKLLRFRRKNAVQEGFKESWVRVWREDRDEFSTREWLDAMHSDGVLQESEFRIDLPTPSDNDRNRIIDLAVQKLEALAAIKTLPPRNLSTCDWPLPCTFRSVCDRNDKPSRKYGLVQIEN